jgi:hypothetical protein
MPGELTLKRDVADGRREELYVSRANLTALYGSLPGEYRRLLDAAGFGRGLTTGIAELAAQASQPAIPARGTPPPPARSSAPAIPARPSAPATAARPTAPRPRHPTQPLLAQAPPRPSGSLTVPRTPRLTAEELRQRAVDPTIPSILAAPPRAPIRRLETPTG